MTNADKYGRFERFLRDKGYDVDNVHFYLKVMEFKREQHKDKAKLAAGIIIDKYLSEDAEWYIGMEASREVIHEYERVC